MASGTSSRLETFFRSKTGTRVIWGTGLVVICAIVILAVSALSSPSGATFDSPPPIVNTAATDYRAALDAAASGDTTKAVTLLSALVKKDPNNTAAAKKLAELTNGANSGSNGSNQGSNSGNNNGSNNNNNGSNDATQTPSRDDSAYLKAVGDLTTLLPKTIPGYKVSSAEDQGDVAVTTAEPVSGANASGRIATVNLTVHDAKTAADAQAFVAKVSKKVYPQNADAKASIGIMTGYYGTNGRELATASFARGRYVFELIATYSGDAASAKSLVLAAASAFPGAK